jgi:hypothetical protein
MEDTGKNLELIDKFIANEHKSKTWAIISVSLFLVMAALVLVFSKRLSETKNKLTVSEDSLRTVNARLSFLNDSIQKVKDSVDLINIGLELNTGKNAFKIDSLEGVNDTLTVLLNTTQQEVIQNNSPEVATRKINDLFQQAFPGPNTNPSDKITQSIIKTNVIEQKTVPLSISVLYMTKYTDLGNKINKLLDRKNFKVERMEPVSGTTFNPAVKYFREEDKRIADRIAGILNEPYASELKQPFISQFIKLKSPARQVEIWIGQYEKPKYLEVQRKIHL